MAKHATRKISEEIQKISQITWEVEPKLLLSPNIPKPMHGMAPRVVMPSQWWLKTKQEAYRSTLWHCRACGVHKSQAKSRQWLEAHEHYEIDYLAGRMTYQRTVPLCHYCHTYIHSGRLQAMMEKGELTQSKFVAVIKHGDAILTWAGLLPSSREEYDGPEADWGDWRLVIDGVEYPPKFKSLKQWCAAFK